MTSAALVAEYGRVQADIGMVTIEWGPGLAVTQTPDEAWAFVLRLHRHARSRDAALLGALGSVPASAVPFVAEAIAQSAAVTSGLRRFSGTGTGAANTPRPAGIVDATNDVRNPLADQLLLDLGRIGDAIVNAIALAAPAAPSAPGAPAAPGTTPAPAPARAPRFIGELPKFGGAAREYRAWASQVRVIIAGQPEAVETAAQVRLRILGCLEGIPADVAATSAPATISPAPGQLRDGTPHKVAQLDATLEWVREAFGPANEEAEARRDHARLRQRDEPFGSFYAQLRAYRRRAGLSMADDDVLDAVRGKCHPSLREWPPLVSEDDLEAFVERAREDESAARGLYDAVRGKRQTRGAVAAPAMTPAAAARNVFSRGPNPFNGDALRALGLANACFGCGGDHQWRACPDRLNAEARTRAQKAIDAIRAYQDAAPAPIRLPGAQPAAPNAAAPPAPQGGQRRNPPRGRANAAAAQVPGASIEEVSDDDLD